MKDIVKKVIIVIVGITINVLGRLLAEKLDLPIWFDMTGTILATYYVGVWGGIVVAIFNNIFSKSYIYAITGVVAVFLVRFFLKKNAVNNVFKVIIASFGLGVVCTIVSTPINCIFYDGYSGNIWGDTLFDMLRWYGVAKVISSLAGEFIVEVVDKQVCMLVAYLIIVAVTHAKKTKAASKVTAALLLVVMLLPTSNVKAAVDNDDKFLAKVYDNTTGMVSSEANVISETDDGYIWIGSYAGLTRYNGTEFEFVREGGLVNVVSMLNDDKGRLWIGTNDAGIARYDNGKYTYFTTSDGLPSNSVRCFAADSQGNVYVGTSDEICRFDSNDNVEVINRNVTFAKSMLVYNGKLIVLDNKGDIYALTDKEKIKMSSTDNDVFYYCIANTSKGIMAGAETGEVSVLEVSDGEIYEKEHIEVSGNEVSAIFEDSKKRIWIATDTGLGYIDADDNYHKIVVNGFDSSIDCFHEDYQGNIWLASSRHGVMKLSESIFVNMFEKTGLTEETVNAVTFYNGDYFCATDKGLIVIDGVNQKQKEHKLTEVTKGSRVRMLYVDADNKLWVCSYGALICYSANEDMQTYNMDTHSLTSDRFRCVIQLKNKTIVAGTADGINYIENGAITAKLSTEQGLENTQILCLLEDKDGNVWAGSDGSGIYVISNKKLIKKYTVNNGLSSDVILRMIPYEDGCFVVTSNALCYIDADGNIKRLNNFPYFNNYDIIINEDKAYITCSAGMYVMEVEALLNDEENEYTFYGANEGLVSGFTANSWNYCDDDGSLLLCSNSGVILFEYNEKEQKTTVKYGIDMVDCDGVKLWMTPDNKYILPSTAKNISIHASVRNYAYENVRVRFYVKEYGKEPKTYLWNELESVQISNIEKRKYHICMQILDGTGENVIEEKLYVIEKQPHAWETPEYKTYLILVGVEIIIFTLLTIASAIHFIVRKNELEKVRVELANIVDEQTGALVLQDKKMRKLFIQTITALSEAVDAKDRYTSGHSKRVAEYARMIAARMGKSKEEQEEIYRAGLLHDVGKIRIPAEIINKPGKLTDEEYNIIKIHPVTGYHILRGISDDSIIAMGTKYHHERYDGKGYPNGLVGDKIPEVARILGVADAYDAMASNRSYREALPQAVVRSEIEKGKGTQFDPHIADIMLQMIDEDTEYTMKQPDSMHRRVLVVDDEPMNIKIISHIMKDDTMYEIVAASSGKEALSILNEQNVDLILLDVMMPDMDGLETLKHIRDKYQIPVVLMTADRNFEGSTEFAKLGCDDYITKPFLPLLIKEVIHNMTERTNIEE
ncbi:MAG: response regulator [Lachnospiraceae bacterium]|nr:response regulator [Lachnospiraceae bacterium]